MNFDWTTFLTSLGGASVIGLAASAFIVKTFFKKKIEAEIESRYATALANLNAKNLQELEGFKAGYQKVLDENQIRFSKFYAEQSNAILEFHQKLATLYIALIKMDAIMKPLPINKDEREKYLAEENRQVSIVYGECMVFYLKIKLLLPEFIWKLVDEYLFKCQEFIIDSDLCRRCPDYADRKLDDARDIVKQELPLIEKHLKRCFLAILNGEKLPKEEVKGAE